MSRSFYYASFERSERSKNEGTRCPVVFITLLSDEVKEAKTQEARCPEVFIWLIYPMNF
ncbi:MAG: hypothetical protein GX270_09395 [Clostridiaceae bacterium]|nr:hypothetical protein [Clostridiaceae bacterium]